MWAGTSCFFLTDVSAERGVGRARRSHATLPRGPSERVGAVIHFNRADLRVVVLMCSTMLLRPRFQSHRGPVFSVSIWRERCRRGRYADERRNLEWILCSGLIIRPHDDGVPPGKTRVSFFSGFFRFCVSGLPSMCIHIVAAFFLLLSAFAGRIIPAERRVEIRMRGPDGGGSHHSAAPITIAPPPDYSSSCRSAVPPERRGGISTTPIATRYLALDEASAPGVPAPRSEAWRRRRGQFPPSTR